MQVTLTPEQEVQLDDLVELTGKQPGELILEAARFLFAEYRPDLDTLDRSIAQADAGNFIEEDEMDRRVARMLRD